MDKLDAKRERRHQRRCERMGTNNPRCLTCINPHVKPHNFHEHHIAGRKYDLDATERIDTLCHGDRSEEARDHPPPISPSKKKSRSECAAHYSLGLSDMLLPVAHITGQYGHRLSDATDGSEPMSHESLLSLAREVGPYLKVLSPFIERAAHRLKWHAIGSIDEERKATARKRRKSQKSHKSES